MNRSVASVALLGISLLSLSASPSVPNAAAGDYSAKLEIKSLRNERTGRTPQLTFSGRFEHAGSNFRLEVSNDLTAESQVYVLNGGSKKAWVLFPDTLNGISTDLASIDKEDTVQQAQQFMKGQYGKLPQDWGQPQKKTETLGGRQVTHLIFSKPKVKGKQSASRVDFWHTAASEPVKLVMDSAAVKLTVTFDNYQANPALPSTRFEPDSSYKIRPLGKDEPFPLPGGMPNLHDNGTGKSKGKAKTSHS